jgi:hypothetical protein
MVRKGSPQLFVVDDQKRATIMAALAGVLVKPWYRSAKEESEKGEMVPSMGCSPGSPIAGVRRAYRHCRLVSSSGWSSGAPDASAAGRTPPNCFLMKDGQSGMVGVDAQRKEVGAAA